MHGNFLHKIQQKQHSSSLCFGSCSNDGSEYQWLPCGDPKETAFAATPGRWIFASASLLIGKSSLRSQHNQEGAKACSFTNTEHIKQINSSIKWELPQWEGLNRGRGSPQTTKIEPANEYQWGFRTRKESTRSQPKQHPPQQTENSRKIQQPHPCTKQQKQKTMELMAIKESGRVLVIYSGKETSHQILFRWKGELNQHSHTHNRLFKWVQWLPTTPPLLKWEEDG